MQKNNFTRSVNFLLIAAFLFTAGCAQKPSIKDHGISEAPPLVPKENKLQAFYRKYIGSDAKKPKIEKKSVEEYATIWNRLFDLYELSDIDNDRVEKHMAWYLEHPDFLLRVQKRAEPYLYLIVNEIEAKQLPGEFALLPIVESSFRPDAYSRSHAAGLWQFIPATGRLFGLKQNWWYDGRRDVYASTLAATRYLKELSELFEGDWLLALAAYNAGKGTVGKAIERNKNFNKPTDYWSLSLYQETMDYVPRLLAIAKIFANAESYGIDLLPIANRPYFKAIDIGAPLDLAKAAAMAKTPIDDLVMLNPGFNRSCTAPNGPHRLLIPVEKAEIFKQNLADLSADDRITLVKHRIKSGENLSLIAQRYNTSVSSIRQINHLSGNRIRAGQFLVIPPPGHDQTYRGTLASRTKSAAQPKRDQFYVVKSGDSLWSIARKFSASATKVAEWNRMSTKSVIRAGQKLRIKSESAPVVASIKPKPISYTVKKGDSLFLISRKFKVTVADLHKWNHLEGYLQPGQKLKVLVDESGSPEA
ncbi:MAG: LysM peptidoglycan-binding domain-containing protein [Gammaproteobacteria bacterium]